MKFRCLYARVILKITTILEANKNNSVEEMILNHFYLEQSKKSLSTQPQIRRRQKVMIFISTIRKISNWVETAFALGAGLDFRLENSDFLTLA